jgi:hypothetical protein
MQKNRTAESAAPFIGTWRLESIESQVKTGERTSVRNERPEGLLIYDACGNVAAQIMWPGRRLLASGNQRDGTTEEIREAFEGYSAYFGTFTVDSEAGSVTHNVRGSLMPNWIGGPLVRFYDFGDDTLTLRTAPDHIRGRELIYTLVWRKENPARQ